MQGKHMRNYIVVLFLSALAFLPGYVLFRILLYKRSGVRPVPEREVVLAVFVLYMCGLFVLLFRGSESYRFSAMLYSAYERLQSGTGIQLMPLRTVRTFSRIMGSPAFMSNIVGNVLLFIPIGLFLPLLWQRWQHRRKMCLLAVCLPVLIEFLQLFVGRYTDIDDVLLNAIGILLGYMLFCRIKRLPGQKFERLSAPQKKKDSGKPELA